MTTTHAFATQVVLNDGTALDHKDELNTLEAFTQLGLATMTPPNPAAF